jgi:hypothetical protein
MRLPYEEEKMFQNMKLAEEIGLGFALVTGTIALAVGVVS